MDAPQLNLAAPALVLSLCYRALAADADGGGYALTLRRLEHSQAGATAQLETRSAGRANLGILEQKEREARGEAQRLALDLQLYNEEQPPVSRQRGVFTRKLAPEEQAAEDKRRELIVLAEQAAQRAGALAAQLQAEQAALGAAEEAQAGLSQDRAALLERLVGQSAAQVLGLIAAGQPAQARELLDNQRAGIRGELITGVLYVLLAWFTAGEGAARRGLLDMNGIFSQHKDPAVRVLEALLAASAGEPLAAQELGLFPREAFSLPGLHRLYQLTRVLAGREPDGAALLDDPFYPTLWVLDQHQRLRKSPDAPGLCRPDALAQWAAGQGLFIRALAANLLLRRDCPQLIPSAAACDFSAVRIPRQASDPWPALLGLVPQAEAAWPPALALPLAQALACHLLYAARREAPGVLYEGWLQESYGWAKTDLYWWVLAMVRTDLALLNNVSGAPAEWFAVAPL